MILIGLCVVEVCD